MYDILFICRHCGVQLSADENDVGISLPCPECAKEISVPTGDVLFECAECGKSLLASADAKHHSFHCPYCDLDVVVPSQGKQVPMSERVEVEPTPEPEEQPPVSVAEAASFTSSDPPDAEKRQRDRFMATWGDYLAQAGLTDETDKKKEK